VSKGVVLCPSAKTLDTTGLDRNGPQWTAILYL